MVLERTQHLGRREDAVASPGHVAAPGAVGAHARDVQQQEVGDLARGPPAHVGKLGLRVLGPRRGESVERNHAPGEAEKARTGARLRGGGAKLRAHRDAVGVQLGRELAPGCRHVRGHDDDAMRSPIRKLADVGAHGRGNGERACGLEQAHGARGDHALLARLEQAREQLRQLGGALDGRGGGVAHVRDLDAPRASLVLELVRQGAGNVAGRPVLGLAHKRALPRRGIGKRELTSSAGQLAKAHEHARRKPRALLGHEAGKRGGSLDGLHKPALAQHARIAPEQLEGAGLANRKRGGIRGRQPGQPPLGRLAQQLHRAGASVERLKGAVGGRLGNHALHEHGARRRRHERAAIAVKRPAKLAPRSRRGAVNAQGEAIDALERALHLERHREARCEHERIDRASASARLAQRTLHARAHAPLVARLYDGESHVPPRSNSTAPILPRLADKKGPGHPRGRSGPSKDQMR